MWPDTLLIRCSPAVTASTRMSRPFGEVLQGFSQRGRAFTTISFRVIIAAVQAFTAVSLAILS